MTLVLYMGWTLVLTGGLVLLALPFATERHAAPLLAFVAVAVLQTAVLVVPLVFGWHLGQWNWSGKIASICVGLAAIRVLGLTRTEVGLVLPAGRRAWLVSAAGPLLAMLLVLAFTVVVGPNDRPNAETLAYQATMPGLDEELAFRGIGMALLARGLGRPRLGLPKWALPLAITSLWFTAAHVVAIEHGHLALMPAAATFVLPMGILLALIRVGSGSLLGGLLGHNAVNVLGDCTAFFMRPTG